MRPLRWNASCHGWIGKTDNGVSIFVSEETYEKRLRAYLESKGMQLKTWVGMMRSAEEAWQRQCKATGVFQENLDYWLTCHEPGVKVIQRSQHRGRE
ncbi:MAG: hypothetical protein ACJ8CB_08150 [Ktedonobacteraceae bacterium]|jgi:hypothetical protein